MKAWPSRPLPTLLGLALAAGGPVFSEQVSPSQALQMAQGWLQREAPPLQARMDRAITDVRAHADADGRTLFFEVGLAPEGFLVLSPDDELEPVIAFSDHGFLDGDPHNPLLALLHRDLPRRLRGLAKRGPSLQRNRWQALQSGAGPAPTATARVNDARVDPLVQSQWNQSGVGGFLVYNYYTPNHLFCGCVATAMAQLMRFHQFPTQGIGQRTHAIVVTGASQSATTRGGDGVGGPYDWTQMPLVPSSTTPDSARKMIGALTYDAGVVVGMDYAQDGSGAYMADAAAALKDVFRYANVVYGATGTELTDHGLDDMVQPNLDAGFPVLFGISGDGGHAIVCDGYGYSGSPAALYHHLNLGWGGNSDAWYTLPDITTSSARFNVVSDCIYNVFPSGGGEILSGRITDAAGLPVPGVAITDGGATATTNARGIYALTGLRPGVHTITAAKAGLAFPQAVRWMRASENGPAVGNVWGVDLVQSGGDVPSIRPQPLDQEVKAGGQVTFVAGATGMGPLHFQWLRNGLPVGSDAPTFTLAGATRDDDQAGIQVRVTGSQGNAISTPARLSVVSLLNGAFEKGALGWSLFNPGVVLGPTDYKEVNPHGGDRWLALGDWSQPTTDFAFQDVQIPAEAQGADLSLWLAIANKSKAPTSAANTFRLQLLDTNDHLLETLLTRDNTQAELSGDLAAWHAYGPYDLMKYKGQTLRVRLESTQPGGSDTGTVFAVDDVGLALRMAAVPTARIAPAALTLVTGGRAVLQASMMSPGADNRVDWTATAGAGSFDPARTAGDGVAATTFLAGTTPGSYGVFATPVDSRGVAASLPLTLVAPSTVTVTITGTPLVLAGSPATFSAAVAPLSDASVIWSATGGSLDAPHGTATAWSSDRAGTFTLTATSVAAPTRSASFQVQVVDLSTVRLSLDRSSAILLPGTSLTLTASGDLGLGVNWDLSGPATHVDQGLASTVTVPASAPLTDATYTLTASHKLDGSKKASALLTVKGMDLQPDGLIDPGDLLALAREWGKGPSSPANFKGAGTVDETDLNALLNQMN